MKDDNLAARVEASMGRVIHITPSFTGGEAACGMSRGVARQRGDWSCNSWAPGVATMRCALEVLPICPLCLVVLPNEPVGA